MYRFEPPVMSLVARNGASGWQCCRYDNVELRCRLPSDEENLPLSLEFPQGNVLGIAKATVPVVVKMTVHRPQSFTADLEFLDENGESYLLLTQS